MLLYQKDKQAKPGFLPHSNVLSEIGERWRETYLPFTQNGLFPYEVRQLPAYQSQTLIFLVSTRRLQTQHQHTSRMSYR